MIWFGIRMICSVCIRMIWSAIGWWRPLGWFILFVFFYRMIAGCFILGKSTTLHKVAWWRNWTQTAAFQQKQRCPYPHPVQCINIADSWGCRFPVETWTFLAGLNLFDRIGNLISDIFQSHHFGCHISKRNQRKLGNCFLKGFPRNPRSVTGFISDRFPNFFRKSVPWNPRSVTELISDRFPNFFRKVTPGPQKYQEINFGPIFQLFRKVSPGTPEVSRN